MNEIQPERVVFVTRQSAAGDVLIAMRAISLLKKNNYFPVFITSILYKDIPLLTKYLNAFICFDKNKTAKFFLHRQEVKKEEFCQFLQNLNTKRKPFFLDLQKTSRSKRAYVFLKKELQFCFEKKYSVHKKTLFRIFLIFLAWLSFSQKKRNTSAPIKRIHELQEAKIKEIILNDKQLFIALEKDCLILLPEHTKSLKKPQYICIFPGASSFIKTWPKENFRQLMARLLTQTNIHIFLCGATQEEEVIAEYLAFPENDRVINLVNKSSLSETLTLVSQAQYVVANDSFAAHAADALCIPASVIFGATSPLFGFVPLFEKISLEYENLSCSPCTRHGKNKCRYENLKCLRNLNAENVFLKIKEQISAR